MDQDTSNTPAKGSWRDKLGIGGAKRDMPKISNEFRPNRNGQNGGEAAQGAPRSNPQIVTKTAPMAPRTPPAASQARPAPRPAPQQAQLQPAPAQNQDLAVRLKAQREAAEKLAQQRVSQARGRTDMPSSDKPRFSFAEEEVAQARRETPPPARDLPPPRDLSPPRDLPPAFVPKQQASPPASANAGAQQAAKPGAAQQKIPPLVPPRPALGGDRPIASAYPSRYTPPGGQQPQGSPGGYRSLDPPAYQAQQLGRQPPRPTPANYAEPHGETRRQPPARETFEAYRRRPESEAGEGYQDFRRGPAPARGRQPAYDEEGGDVFEDESARPPRRRASAQDYNQAYRDYDEGYEEPQRRKGPWLLLLALLLAAIAAGGIIYYYLTQIKPAGQTGGNVPVINAPEQPTKVDPEPDATTGQQGNATGASDAQRKQIYDRILGEETIDGNRIVPTEQQPRAVEPGSSTTQPGNAQPGNQAQPNNGTQPGANNTANPDGTVEPLPLPLPPPPGDADQQGNLTNGVSEQVAAAAAKDNQTLRNPEPASAEDIIAPISGENDPPAKPGAKAAQPAQAKITPPPEPVEDAVAAPEKPAAVKKPAGKAKPGKAKATKKVAAEAVPEQQVTAEEPLVLVPPAQPEPANAQKKSGPFFGIFAGENKRPTSGSPVNQRREDAITTGAARGNWQTAPQSEAQPETLPADAAASDQVSSITASSTSEPEAAQPPHTENVVVAEAEPLKPTGMEEKTQAAGPQYIAQLASFRSEAEAMAEYDRLRARHGGMLKGLRPSVTASTISGSARYRLGVGPLASRQEASNICNSLISAGERDCLVRGN